MKKEDILKEAITISSKIGDWEKFCELSVEANEWERAIMAAPNVSIKYWQDLTKKYADFCNKNENENKVFSALLSGEVQPALNHFIESKDYEDAKLIWVTRTNKTKVAAADSFENNFNFDKESADAKIKYLSKEDELFSITHLIAKDYMTKGSPILAAGSYLSIGNIFYTLKTLVRVNELEIAYMMMNLTSNKTFEREIITGLSLKELKKGRW